MNLRKGKTKNILENSIDSALLAVEVFNKPRTKFRTENYISLMIMAWTKLFHAYYQNIIGNKYSYKNKRNRYELVDGERKAWELSECIKNYPVSNDENPVILTDAIIANLRLFIKLRNKIEHRYIDKSYFDMLIFGECQALLYNFENFLVAVFGDEYSINEDLAFSLQFSHIRTKEQINSQKTMLVQEVQELKSYVEKYRSDLSSEVYNSMEYSIKLIQIPKISNTNRNDLAIEFVNWNSLDENDRLNYEKLNAIIKDKVIKQDVANYQKYKPSDVVREVNQISNVKISVYCHTLIWKTFEVRPSKDSQDPFNTNDKYCIYDETHDDYVYTQQWIDFVKKFLSENKNPLELIKQEHRINIKDYE